VSHCRDRWLWNWGFGVALLFIDIEVSCHTDFSVAVDAIDEGGYGYSSRKFGMNVDSMLGVEVVTIDERKEPKVVVAERGSDLLWAHQGGAGGNFGVVTSLKVRSHYDAFLMTCDR